MTLKGIFKWYYLFKSMQWEDGPVLPIMANDVQGVMTHGQFITVFRHIVGSVDKFGTFMYNDKTGKILTKTADGTTPKFSGSLAFMSLAFSDNPNFRCQV